MTELAVVALGFAKIATWAVPTIAICVVIALHTNRPKF